MFLSKMAYDICEEQIDGDFWHADYLGLRTVAMKSNGYINATKLCSDGGKRFENWLRNKDSKEKIDFYNSKLFVDQSNDLLVFQR